MECAALTSICYFTRYHIFSLSLAWFGDTCNALERKTIKFIKKHVLIFKKKKKMTVMCGNALQIAQNQPNLEENMP